MAKENLIEPAYASHRFATDEIYRARCVAQAKEWAKANRTDPFAFDCAMNQFKNGIAYAGSPEAGALFAGAEGFNVMWSQELRTFQLGEHAVEFHVPVPINMKRP